MKCYFCFAEGEVPRLSKEHLLSRPVAAAFGVNRSSYLAQVDLNDGSSITTPLDDVAVRFVCERCNSSWMNALEHGFARVADWIQADSRPLTEEQERVVRAWALKTYLVLSVLVGGARRFMDDPQASGVIPNFTRARQLYLDDDDAFEGMAFGVARPQADDQFAYAFGNPTVTPQGPRFASQKSAGVSIITVGGMQVWAVDPTLFRSADITFPDPVVPLQVGLAYDALHTMPVLSRPEVVLVNNGPHDIVQLFERLNDWSASTQQNR